MSTHSRRRPARPLGVATSLVACVAVLFAAACEQKGADVPGPGRIAGKVVLLTAPGTATTPATETPVARARVSLAGTDRTARTDSTGAFAFDDVAPGRLELFVEADGASPITKSDIAVAADATTDVGTLRLFPQVEEAVPDSDKVGTLMGKAYLAGWPPTTAIEIVAVAGNASFRTRTNALGRFTLEQLPVGAYDLFVRTDTPGFTAESLKIEVRAGVNNIAQDILLTASDERAQLPAQEETPAGERGAEGIFGAILLRESAAMQRECFSDAAVSLSGPPARVSGLSMTGQFSFQAIGTGTYTLTLESPMIMLAEPVTIELREGMSTTAYVDAILRPDAPADRLARARAAEGIGAAPLEPLTAEPGEGETATLVGRVALATPNQLGATLVSLAGTPYNGTPGTDGSFRLEGIVPGRYDLTIAAPEHLPYGPASIDMPEAGTYDIGEIVLEPDIERPRVIAAAPANGARDVPIDYVVPFTIEFDQDMDVASVKAAVSVSPAATFRLFMGRESPRSSERILYGELYGVKVPQPLDHRTTYRIALAASARNVKGVGLAAPFGITFTTSAPAIIDTFPRPGTSGNLVSVNEPLLIFCNAPIDASTVDERLVTIRPSTAGSDPLVRVTVDAETGWGILEVSYPFDINTSYRVRVNSRFRTISGKGFSNVPYSFSFKTGEVRTRTMEQVSSGGRRGHRNPQGGSGGVYPAPRTTP